VSLVRDPAGAPLHFVAQVQDITARKTADAELERYTLQLQALSEHDSATGLSNSRAFSAALADEVRAAHARDGSCALVLAKVDRDADLPAVVDLLRDGSR
jgi:PleD family two-component response regulator